MVIEGNWGLGESVVSGMVSPDEYIVSKDSLSIEEVRCGSKLIEIIPDQEKGTRQQRIPREKQQVPCLTEAEVRTLAEIGRKLEVFFHHPQDFEWAIDPNLPSPYNVFILQSRPVTITRAYKSPLDQLVDALVDYALK
jgi:pyruvate,water dikinase